MSERISDADTVRANDGLVSFTSGMGDPTRDKRATASYVRPFLSQQQIDTAYDGSWIARKIIDIPAEDATRKWRGWQADADQISKLEAEENRLGLRRKVERAKKIARRTGGAGIVIGDGAPDPMEPLNVEAIKRGGLKYLTVLSKDKLVAGDTDGDPASPTYGSPLFYTITDAVGVPIDIHASRIAVFSGDDAATPLLDGWGVSVLQPVFEAMKNADSTHNNIASLVFEANVDHIGIPRLMERIASKEGENTVLTRLALAQLGKSTTRTLVTDAEETYTRNAVSFTNLPEVLQQMLTIVSGASDIPVSRFMGTSEGGLNTTGEGSERNYHEHIESLQNNELTPSLYMIDECLIRSALGGRPPEVWYSWRPLRVKTEKETVEQGKALAEIGKILGETGLYTRDELRTALSNAMIEAGVLPGLEAAMVKTAKAGAETFDEPEDGADANLPD